MAEQTNQLVDRGFDSDFSRERVAELSAMFGSEELLQNLVNRMHEQDHCIDMKRGEFYPEILRCIASMKRAAAWAYGVDPAAVQPNFGSNGSIDTILVDMKLREVKARIDPSRQGGVLVATPTYFRNYNSCEAKQLELVKIPLNERDWSVDTDGMIARMHERRPTAVFLVTPNNPTGVAIPDAELRRICSAAPQETVVVIDRTLANIEPEVATADLLREFQGRNLVVLHSLSKYAGLSHLRVGFALYANLSLANEMAKHLPLGLGVEGAVKATLHLLNGPIKPADRLLAWIRQNKALLRQFTNVSKSFACSDFVGNYCILKLGRGLDSRAVTAALERGGANAPDPHAAANPGASAVSPSMRFFAAGGHEFNEARTDLMRVHTGGDPRYMELMIEVLDKVEHGAR